MLSISIFLLQEKFDPNITRAEPNLVQTAMTPCLQQFLVCILGFCVIFSDFTNLLVSVLPLPNVHAPRKSLGEHIIAVISVCSSELVSPKPLLRN